MAAIIRWMTLQAAAVYYGIPTSTLRYWIKIKQLNPANGLHLFGATYRINAAEFETKFMDSGTGPRTPSRKKAPAPATPAPFDFSEPARV